jgi:hypothetical protein
VLEAAITGVLERFEALDALASKAVHLDIASVDADMLAINTYIVADEILRHADLT